MLVVSTTKLGDQLEKKLIDQYPALTFKFFENIKEASTLIKEMDILMTFGEDLTDDDIYRATKLKWIMVLSAGVDQMPFKAIQERGILITNARGIHKVPMAEYAIAMLLNYYRQNLQFAHQQAEKRWDKSIPTREISGRTMTIVGAGAIGEELARLAKAFYMTTYAVTNSGGSRPYFDQVFKNDSVKAALAQADFVVSILPSTPSTKGYYQAEHFEAMKQDAVFLNMGRGDAVTEKVLLHALDTNQIEHAILDVTEIEPLPEDSPIWSHGKITLTPHISGKSAHYLSRAMVIFEQNLDHFLKGKSLPINQIDPARGY